MLHDKFLTWIPKFRFGRSACLDTAAVSGYVASTIMFIEGAFAGLDDRKLILSVW